jgi:UDP-N-acetylglucosamine--N-acetylmuramyl-(pentapeptide) pyrophosphoryl-undecaprenol N-acetylglucosamine transferase
MTEQIALILGNPDAASQMARAALSAGKPDAAETLAARVNALAHKE